MSWRTRKYLIFPRTSTLNLEDKYLGTTRTLVVIGKSKQFGKIGAEAIRAERMVRGRQNEEGQTQPTEEQLIK